MRLRKWDMINVFIASEYIVSSITHTQLFMTNFNRYKFKIRNNCRKLQEVLKTPINRVIELLVYYQWYLIFSDPKQRSCIDFHSQQIYFLVFRVMDQLEYIFIRVSNYNDCLAILQLPLMFLIKYLCKL